MGSETALTIVVAINALAFLVLAVVFFLLYRGLSAARDDVTRLSGDMQSKFSAITENVAEVTRTFKPLSENLERISANVASITNTLRTRTEDLDAFVGETTDMLRTQVHQLNEFVTDTTLRLSDTANTVHRGILAPISEISAMVKGLRAGIGVFFSRWPGNSRNRPPSPDDEMFI